MAQPFRPTLKEKKRYVVYEPANDTAVTDAYKELFGIHGLSEAGIKPVKKNGTKSMLKVAHTHVDQLKAALVWTGKTSITVSGTLKKAALAL